MNEFEREERYIVIKRKHLSGRQEAALRSRLYGEHIPLIECVVVEHDWPEYEPVWQMIEARMTGTAPQPSGQDVVEPKFVRNYCCCGECGVDGAYDSPASARGELRDEYRAMLERCLPFLKTMGDIARYITADVETLLASKPAVVGGEAVISTDELAAFHRFCETCEDFESGGYDVPKEDMQRLARIGVVRWCGGSRYETTDFGDVIRARKIAPPIVEAEAVRDAERYRWLRDKGAYRNIAGLASMNSGRGPYIYMELPSCNSFSNFVLTGIYADAHIDAAIAAASSETAQ